MVPQMRRAWTDCLSPESQQLPQVLGIRLSDMHCHSPSRYVEAGASEHARTMGGKGSDCHHAAVIGDTGNICCRVNSQLLLVRAEASASPHLQKGI